ncbi:MAG: hypothetical protein KAY24_17375, partial [Candidatus Eisenbacteria sp.]|nr:hypothetical protein [Candidatus Eisenbacteria bacterium]
MTDADKSQDSLCIENPTRATASTREDQVRLGSSPGGLAVFFGVTSALNRYLIAQMYLILGKQERSGAAVDIHAS